MEITLTFMSGSMFKSLVSMYTNKKYVNKCKKDKKLLEETIDILDKAFIMLSESNPKEINSYRIGNYLSNRSRLTTSVDNFLEKLLENKCYRGISAYFANVYTIENYKNRIRRIYYYNSNYNAELPKLDLNEYLNKLSIEINNRGEIDFINRVIDQLINDDYLPDCCKNMKLTEKVECIASLHNVCNYSYCSNGSYNLGALFNSHESKNSITKLVINERHKDKCRHPKLRDFHSDYWWGSGEHAAFGGRAVNVLTSDRRAEVIAKHITNFEKDETINSTKLITLIMTFVNLMGYANDIYCDLETTVSDDDIKLVWDAILNLCKNNKKILNRNTSYVMALDLIRIYGTSNDYINEFIDEIYDPKKIKKLEFEQKLN